MAEKPSLRDYQRTLSARLVNPDAGQSASKLGVQAGGTRWLVDLADTSEVIPAPQVYPVPLTRTWFLGVTNIRDNPSAQSLRARPHADQYVVFIAPLSQTNPRRPVHYRF